MSEFPRYMTLSFSDSDEMTGGQACMYEKVEWSVPNTESVGPAPSPVDGAKERRGLRYGENPTQPAVLYRPINGHLLLAGIEFIRDGQGYLTGGLDEAAFIRFGKHPSKTNLTDIDSGLAILKHLSAYPAAVIMKHNNPSGAAIGATIAEAYRKAWECDPIAPFGGAIVVNRPLTMEAAELIAAEYYEVVAAPEFEEGVVEKLAARKNLRIVRMASLGKLEEWAEQPFLEMRVMQDGSIVCQKSYLPVIGENAAPIRSLDDFRKYAVVPRDVPEREMVSGKLQRTGRMVSIENQPTDAQWRDLWFGWIVQTGVTSNSVLLVKNGGTVSIACGGQDRVLISKQCVWKAHETRRALASLQITGVLYDVARLKVARGELKPGVIEQIESKAAEHKYGLIDSVAASDAFFPFRDGPDALLDAGVRAIVQPGGSLRESETIDACNERGASMVFTGQRCFRH